MNKFVVIQTQGKTVIAMSGGKKFIKDDCSDEFYQSVLDTEGDLEELENLFNPNLKKVKEDNKVLEKFLVDTSDSSYLVNSGDCLYIPSISDVSVPFEVAKAVLKAEKGEGDLDSILNFWRLCSMNPNSNARANLFWFLKKWGMRISKSGFVVAYRNAELKDKDNYSLSFEDVRDISNAFLEIKLKEKKNPADYVVVKNNLDEGKLEIKHKDDEELDSTYIVRYYPEEGEDDYIYDEETDEEYEIEEKYFEWDGDQYEVLDSLDVMYKELSRDKDLTTFTDNYSKSTTIKIGKVVSIPRKECDEEQVSCSRGLMCSPFM
mgnify:FL=1|jgi:hypothetical protein